MMMIMSLLADDTGITQALVPIAVFVGIVLAIMAILSMIAERNARSSERLMRHSRPASLAEIEDPKLTKKSERFQGITEMAKSISQPLMPHTELEQSALKVKLANAGFRSESAAAVYSGIRVASLALFLVVALGLAALYGDTGMAKFKIVLVITVFGFYLPSMALWWLRKKRQQEIFLTLPDALDLLVVCVESGLGLDDVKSLAAILIQADRFGSSVAQALRVQSDSMRIKRRQIAEEKAAKTAVQMIFPLVLFIFPGIFVVLVGPAAVAIYQRLLKK